MKNREWKTFSLGDEKYFTLHATLNGIDKNKLVDNGEKKYPYITRSKNNNGLDMFVSEQPQKINKGNVIIIGLDTQTVFYQESDFYTGQNVQILYNEHLTKNIAFFLIPIIKKQLAVLNWGGNGATLGRLKKKSVVLPVKSDGTPDWGFMESYICEKSNQINDTYKLPSFHEISDNRKLRDVDWDNFFIEEIIYVKSGVRLTKDNQEAGDIPFIGAVDNNNGITSFINNKNNSTDQNVLGTNYNGSVGYAFYHPYEATFSDDVKRLSFKEKNSKYTLLFLKHVVERQAVKYAYGYKFNGQRMKRQIVKLPVKNGKPDFDFMEQYMKRMENRVISKIGKL